MQRICRAIYFMIPSLGHGSRRGGKLHGPEEAASSQRRFRIAPAPSATAEPQRVQPSDVMVECRRLLLLAAIRQSQCTLRSVDSGPRVGCLADCAPFVTAFHS